MAQKKTSTPPLIGDGLPKIDLVSVKIPQAFHPTQEGAKQALEAMAPAMAIMADIQALCAGLEIEKFFSENESIESVSIDEDNGGDDEGQYWTETRVGVQFTDGTATNDYESDLNDAPDGSEEGTPARYELAQAASSFLEPLMGKYPLIRSKIMSHKITRSSVSSMAGKPAAARQEAFAISRVVKPASELEDAEAARL